MRAMAAASAALLVTLCLVVVAAAPPEHQSGAADGAGEPAASLPNGGWGAPGAERHVDETLSGTIVLSGAWALYPMVVRWAEEFRREHPNGRVDVGAGGAGKGMADALAGMVDLGMVSREVYPPEIERGAWWVSVTRDAVVPVVSVENPVLDSLVARGVTRERFRDVWLEGSVSEWDDIVAGGPAAPVRAYTRSDACGAAQTWAAYLGGTQEELVGVGVYGDPGLAEAVRRDAFGIGYNNINYAYDHDSGRPVPGLVVVPIDLDESGRIEAEEDFYSTMDEIVAAIGEGRYPSPPSRDLHLVSHGVPTRPEVVAFLEWILTEGQALVAEAGYISLSDETLTAQLGRLGE